MSLFADYPQAIATAVKAALPALQTVETHGGRFTEDEIRRWGVKAPAVLVSVLGSEPANTAFDDMANLTFCFYVCCKNTGKADRDELALNLVQALLRLLKNQTWHHDGFCKAPEAVQAQNLFSSGIDKTGLSLWAITWSQLVDLGAVTDMAELDDFITLHAQWDVDAEQTDNPVAEDDITLPIA